MKTFRQIDRRITVNGKSYLVRAQEMPGNKWRAFDMEHEFHVTEIDKESAFDKWEEKAMLSSK